MEIKIYPATIMIECPNCGEDQEGFMGDPRGGEFECEDCDMDYTVPEDSEIVIS